MPPAVDTQTATAAHDAAATKRLKKREIDRRCQREARQRTKSRIAYLEGLVEELRRKDTSGQVASLMQQVAEVRKERDMFARTLRGIEDSIRSHRSVLDGLPIKQEPTSPLVTTGRAQTAHRQINPGPESPKSIKSSPEVVEVDNRRQASNAESSSHDSLWPRTAPASENASKIDDQPRAVAGSSQCDPGCDCCDTRATESNTMMVPLQPDLKSVWRFAHSVLDHPPIVDSKSLQWEDEISDDIPVRAVLEGWPAAVARMGGRLPPLWEKLRRIDEVIFGKIDRTERLAILYVMHLLLRYHAEPSSIEARKKVPHWYLARPSQGLAHSYALDFFTWPGIRERLIFSQHSYCSNIFWAVHNTALKVLWQYDFRDCYSVNIQSGSYQLSQAFEERVMDINAWTMRPEFFRRWPEFYGDIPSLDSIATPLHVISPVKNAMEAGQRHLATSAHAEVSEKEDRNEHLRNNDDHQQDSVPRLHNYASTFSSDAVPRSEPWKSPFIARVMPEQNLYATLSQDSYLPMLSAASPNTWDMRTPGAMPAQDWLWLPGGMDTGLSETGG